MKSCEMIGKWHHVRAINSQACYQWWERVLVYMIYWLCIDSKSPRRESDLFQGGILFATFLLFLCVLFDGNEKFRIFAIRKTILSETIRLETAELGILIPLFYFVKLLADIQYS